MKIRFLKRKHRPQRPGDKPSINGTTNAKATERLKAPPKTRETVTIAPSTTPGPDVRLRR